MTTSMSMRICKFPGCARPVGQATGSPGRPGEYCDDVEHTAVRAWRARRAAAPASVGEPDDLGRPVAMAAARAAMLRDDLVKTAEALTGQLTRAVEELRVLADPGAASAQVETVTAEAAQQVAAAEVVRNRADAGAREARSALAEANAAAQELEEQLQEALTAGIEADRARQDALVGFAVATESVQALTDDLAAAAGERDAVAARVEEMGRDLAATREQLAAATRHGDEVTVRAERDRAAAERSMGRVESRLAEGTARVTELDRQLGAARELLDTSHAGQARLEAQLVAATQRGEEATARTERADAARVQADRDRVTAEKAGTRLEAQLEQARERIEELAADRDRLTASLTKSTRPARGAAPAAAAAPGVSARSRGGQGGRRSAPPAADDPQNGDGS